MSSGMIRGTGMVSTFHPAAIPAEFKTILEHWAEAGVCEDSEDALTLSLTVEPPQIMTSGV
jgi:hypothetical protein